jgi:hypothetical protein
VIDVQQRPLSAFKEHLFARLDGVEQVMRGIANESL